MVWASAGSSGTDTSGSSIQGQRYASNGSALGAEFQVNADTTFDQGSPSVAVAASGETAGGIAFWAHIAGFVVGISGVLFFRRPERQRVEWWDRP